MPRIASLSKRLLAAASPASSCLPSTQLRNMSATQHMDKNYERGALPCSQQPHACMHAGHSTHSLCL
jgi:hypothetical protein